jgi:amidase
LYCLKPTIPIISQEGVIPISNLSDSIGPMARSPLDVAYMLDAMVDPLKTSVPKGGYSTFLQGHWKGLRVGALNVEPWLLSSFVVKPVESATRQMVSSIFITLFILPVYRFMTSMRRTPNSQSCWAIRSTKT